MNPKDPDRYSSFAELSASAAEELDFRVELRAGSSGIAVLAPHGGSIERGTSEIANAVAGADHAYYSFVGLLPGERSWDLHLTSTSFDEPRGAALAEESETALTIHRCRGSEAVAYFGGLDEELKSVLAQALTESGFAVSREPRPGLKGISGRNLCNRGRRGRGVQIEISGGLCDLLLADSAAGGELFHTFAAALRSGLQRFAAEQS